MVSDDVRVLQMDLAYLGYSINKTEYEKALFGKTTRLSILRYQSAKHLPVRGEYDSLTRKQLIEDLEKIKPGISRQTIVKYNIQGSVHDYFWKPVSAEIRVLTRSGDQILATRKTTRKGFFHVPFQVPGYAVKLITRDGWAPFDVKVQLYVDNKLASERDVKCFASTTWCNFTEDRLSNGTVNWNGHYKGPSEYEINMLNIEKAVGTAAFDELLLYQPRKAFSRDVIKNAVPADQLRMLILSHNLSKDIKRYTRDYSEVSLTPDVFYGLFRSDILNIKDAEALFSAKVSLAVSNVKELLSYKLICKLIEKAFTKNEKTISLGLNNAIDNNYIKRENQVDKTIWTRIRTIRHIAAISLRNLEDNACLADFLGCTSIPKSRWCTIGSIYSDYLAIGDSFLQRLGSSRTVISEAEYNRLIDVITMGHVVLNKPDVIVKALNKLGQSYIGSVVKFEDAFWNSLVKQEEKTEMYRRMMDTYPDEWFIACMHTRLPKDGIISLLYDGVMFIKGEKRLILSDFDSIHDYTFSVEEIGDINTGRAVHGVRRIYLISDNADIAEILWKDKLTSAVAIRHAYGKKDFIEYMVSKGIDSDAAAKAYSNVEAQYMRVVAFYKDYKAVEEDRTKGDVQANIKNLFGSQDAYNYDKSMSLLGQSAYYVDLLRFLKQKPSEKAGKSAYDILMGRRLDLAYVNLESRNSETLLPYIDLACEILERTYLKWAGKPFDYNPYNTTDTSEHLIAYPANTSKEVYTKISQSTYPVTTSGFNLWMEQSRACLNALGTPRYLLMEKYGKSELEVAAEYFGFSPMELEQLKDNSGLSTSELAKKTREQWNINTADGTILVRDFMRRAGLSYEETVKVCSLFGFRLFGADITNKGYPDVDTQSITLDSDKSLQLMQRFIRIWRHIPWDMDQLCSFLNSSCGGQLDESVLVSLYRAICPTHPNKQAIGALVSTLMADKGIDPNDYIYSSSASKKPSLDPVDCGIDEDMQKRWAEVGSIDEEIALSEEILKVFKEHFRDLWPEELTKAFNPVREKKRDALVAFMIETCERKVFANIPQWKSVSDIYDDLLVDVMMNAPMQTSRIKQATGSVQLFVQRCLLNLEPDIHISSGELNDHSSSDSWGQWSWMKNYRVWEANRKLFLFPENWVEPELRDNMTPFFKEFLENVDQVDATKENLEDALLQYLYKLDEVSHLEVCNIYREIIKESNKDVLHVIARTKSTPTVYYYRTCDLKSNIWTAWERVDVDIAGDQITIAIYRGKIHIFWLTFIEKAMKPTKLPDEDDRSVESREPVKYYELQLNWTIRKNGTWTSKTTSKKKIIHPWERPQYCYDLKSYLDDQARLHLDVYLSTSPEFNNRVFIKSSVPEFKCHSSRSQFNQTYLPWHSSTFLFEGYVTEVYMKDISHEGVNSVDFINSSFGEDGREIKRLSNKYTGPALYQPEGMHLKFNRLVNNSGISKPYLTVGEDLPVYNSRVLLEKVKAPYEMVITQQTVQMDALQKGAMMFFQDNNRAFSLRTSGRFIYQFKPFYHPFTLDYVKELNLDGVDGLLSRKMQTLTSKWVFENSFAPTESVSKIYPKEDVDFSIDGAYSIYNWELFFHIPLTIACRLSQNMKYEDAMNWFHYIFNPMEYTKGQTPQCYWITEPFHANSAEGENGTSAGRIETILRNISKNSAQLNAWKNNPYKPHIVAQFRTETYQKMVVMKYIENLISWADDLFRQDTWETINEAIMLYTMAAEILGDRPEKVQNDSTCERAVTNFLGLSKNLDAFGNNTKPVQIILDAMLAMEDRADLQGFRDYRAPSVSSSTIPTLDVFYFNVPSNDSLVGYWNTVEDRMFKIRNSMNIDGVVRTLSLNAPEIDPAALVRAAASGLDVSKADLGAGADRPQYRFKVALQKAVELCQEARAIGDKLLSAIEKEDAAQLSNLRSEQEISVLKAATRLKEQEIEATKESIKNLEISLKKAEIVHDHYANIEHISDKENKVLKASTKSLDVIFDIQALNTTASVITIAPSVIAGLHGIFGSAVLDSELFSGENVANSLKFAAEVLSQKNTMIQQKSGILSTMASYERRSEDWNLQAKTAEKEIESLESQIRGLNIRLSMAEQELENHRGQIENSNAVYQLVKSQFSGQKLYNWLKNESAKIYKKIYELAYSYAKKAELCYAYELGDNAPANMPKISMDNWNESYKGLMAGDYLLQQLRALEQSYLDNDRRCYELTKRISLAELQDAAYGGSALVRLLSEGTCTVDLPEWLYDLDYRTHGNRRIKNVSVTIPCVVGPNTNVNCKLTLLKEIRRTKDKTGQVLDLSMVSDMPQAPSIATSTGVNDSGLFEINFNGEKYLPFEGYGAVSRWRVDLPIDTNHFDRSSISDVILTITYYAQDMGEHATNDMTFVRVISCRHEFASEWHKCALEGSDLQIVLDETILQSYLRSRFPGLSLKSVTRQTNVNGHAQYENIPSGFEKAGKRITVSGAGRMISSGTEDILLVLTC